MVTATCLVVLRVKENDKSDNYIKKEFMPGDEITGLDKDSVEALVKSGSAEKRKPAEKPEPDSKGKGRRG
ncbi:MAG: hypothetical protein ACRBHB_18100 [Arenicella sp.]